MNLQNLTSQATELLKNLISTQSYSGEEDKTAGLIETFLAEQGANPYRLGNNVYAYNHGFDESKPTILLNSHHDTVKAQQSWTKDPFNPEVDGDKLYGLGSNDAGGALVSLLAAFIALNETGNLPYNLVFLASAEEESSGKNGVAKAVPELGKIDLGIIGEPTEMQMAVAEKGLMVLDCIARGKSGHAARNEGENAIYKAMPDIEWFRTYQFPKVSETLGKINMAVTQIEAGYQHNVTPDQCKFVVDVRTHDQYTNQEVVDIIKQHVDCEVHPRSLRLNPSFIPMDHPLVARGFELGLSHFGSPTLSDQSLMEGFPTIKIGPGQSKRSHTPDEFIYLSEIEQGIKVYIELLKDLNI